jgi:hypothetical protein
MNRPFLVLALPRSRTKWLAGFLSWRDWHCGHDELMRMRSLDDCRAWFSQPCIGTVETACAPFWRLIPPDVRIVTVRRPVEDVLASVVRAVPGCDPAAMRALLLAHDRKLDQIEARLPGVLRVTYDELATEAGCAAVLEHCTGLAHDPVRWAMWDARNVSGDIAVQTRYCVAFLPQLQKLALAAKHRILAGMAPRERPETWEGFTFQDESIDRWYADAPALFR